jgi:pimeloyl-[acyl-carrier protein] methyl ester esterase
MEVKLELVLLPGMDGTGLLFDRLVARLTIPCRVLALPAGTDQSYGYLAQVICTQLPQEDCILLAESFSGPIAALIAQCKMPQVKAVIFIATFLAPPRPVLLSIAAKLPLQALLKMPLAGYVIRRFMLGSEYPIELFFTALKQVPQADIKARLIAVAELNNVAFMGAMQLPALYLQAENDYLVTAAHAHAFKLLFPQLTQHALRGTHFLAQSNPLDCAEKIDWFIRQVEQQQLN